MMTAGTPAAYAEGRRRARGDGGPRSTGWASAPATAARSRSSTSCWRACIAAAAEAMALGLREGVDAAALYEVITHSAGNSWMFENRMAHVLAGDYTPLSAVDIFVKDLGLVLDTARASKFRCRRWPAPRTRCSCSLSSRPRDEDDSAVIKIFPASRCRRRIERARPATPTRIARTARPAKDCSVCIADASPATADRTTWCATACARCRRSACRGRWPVGCRRGGGGAAEVAHDPRRRGQRSRHVAALRWLRSQGVAAGLLQVLLDVRLPPAGNIGLVAGRCSTRSAATSPSPARRLENQRTVFKGPPVRRRPAAVRTAACATTR